MGRLLKIGKRARGALACLLALELAFTLVPFESFALTSGAAAAGAASSQPGFGQLEVVKRGGPLIDRNAEDRFPVTIELVNEHGYDLEGVTVSGCSFLSEPEVGCEHAGYRAVKDALDIAHGAAAAASDLGCRSFSADKPLVALIDTGAPVASNVVARYSVVGEGADDGNGHGTAMLDAILRENPDAQIVSIKALGADGRGTAAGVRAACALAVRAGADVVNLSLCALDTLSNRAIAAGVADALSAGCAVVAAAGNGGFDASRFTPANLEGVCTVGAVDGHGRILDSSNRGEPVDAFVTASCTSEAAARMSGRLSCGAGMGDVAVPVGNDARRIERNVLANGGAYGCPEACANKTTYEGAMAFETGSFTIAVAGAKNSTITLKDKDYGKNWKSSHTVTVTSSNEGFIKPSSSTAKSIRSGTSEYYRYFILTFSVLMPAGLHGTGCSKDIDMLMDATVDEVNWASSPSGLGAQNPTATWRTLKVRFQTGSIGMATSNYALWTGAKLTISTAKDTYALAYNGNPPRSGVTLTGVPAAQVKTYGVDLALQSGKPSASSVQEAGYNVTLDANGGSCAQSGLTAGRTTMYTFKNWNTAANGSGSSYNPGSTYKANAASTLYAQWEASTRTSPIDLPTPSREGHEFRGWSESSTAAEGVMGSYVPAGDVTLHAIWVAHTRRTIIVYPKAGQSVTLAGIPEGTSYVASDGEQPSRWRLLTESPQAGEISPGQVVSVVTESAYDPFTVSFQPNGGTGRIGSESVAAGAGLTVPPCSFTRVGYEFEGWNTASDGSGRSFAVGDELCPDDDTQLFAQWNALQLSFSVPTRLDYVVRASGELVGASGQAERIVNLTDVGLAVVGVKAEPGKGCTITSHPRSEGEVEYAFTPAGEQPFSASSAVGGGFADVNWRIAKRGSLLLGDFNGKMACWSEEGSTRRSLGTITWRLAARGITVAFDGNGAGGFMESQRANAESAFPAPACQFDAPSNKRFLGWSASSDGEGATWAAGSPIEFEDDVTLYARWG